MELGIRDNTIKTGSKDRRSQQPSDMNKPCFVGVPNWDDGSEVCVTDRPSLLSLISPNPPAQRFCFWLLFVTGNILLHLVIIPLPPTPASCPPWLTRHSWFSVLRGPAGSLRVWTVPRFLDGMRIPFGIRTRTSISTQNSRPGLVFPMRTNYQGVLPPHCVPRAGNCVYGSSPTPTTEASSRRAWACASRSCGTRRGAPGGRSEPSAPTPCSGASSGRLSFL